MFRKAVVTQIGSVLRQALTTFSSVNEIKGVFHSNLALLKTMLERITAEDVGFDPLFMSDALWNRPHKAPVTYVNIYENDVLSVGIFVLKPGMKLPLHDHPQMYGLIKVIAGKIKITSFSLNTEKTVKVESNVEDNIFVPKTHVVEMNTEIIADISSESCCLEPDSKNLHEIESLDGPAAFLDILSPPYETLIESNGKRKCTYYKIKKELSPSVFVVEETNSPSWFWSDSYPYTGPELV
ncbi:2-aminoethanethiol dioxygenase-like [Agrilus planipennis]|uniref:2-aminoethanethiol dioxygenase n=1 Tax=Agrilus planipennis TaxID=224129 RepID=A0A1W4WVA0_AGRPL|nr:2-aminoethanethiol dioxygenase [Agrilus planipennis]XP_025836291.1 2-aminoethanethiol dioxygenase-like [Agrilus planipennis]